MDNKTLDNRVVKLIMTCSDEELKGLTVSSIARTFNLDRSHLSREFKSGKNITLCQFIQGEKMARAAMLLKDTTDLKMSELSEKLGFCSDEYFREVFKRHFGISPSKYRAYRNHCKKGSNAVGAVSQRSD